MPLTEKGRTIKGAMQEQYGEKKGESVFYASKNKGKIKGVDAFRTSIRDSLSKGMSFADALGRGVTAATSTHDAVQGRRKTFFRNMRDAAANGRSARDAIADALGGSTAGAAAVERANKAASTEAERIERDRALRDYGVPGMKKGQHKAPGGVSELGMTRQQHSQKAQQHIKKASTAANPHEANYHHGQAQMHEFFARGG
jgi:hypothetical protein